jgi:FkbM family methyltransferase
MDIFGSSMPGIPFGERRRNPLANNWSAYYWTRILQKLDLTGWTLGLGARARCTIPNPPGILKNFATRQGRKNFEADASLRAVRKLVRSAKSFWDVGANCGLFSLFASEENPDLFIVSIEASTVHYGTLTSNWALQPSERWLCLHTAVGDRDGVTHLSRRESGFDHVVEDPQVQSDTEVELRPIAKLDTLAAVLGAESIDVLKIDVEGYELKVLQGAVTLLDHRRVGAIVLESDGHDRRYGSSQRETNRFLEDRGYRVDASMSQTGEISGNCLVFKSGY